jgi:O-antigen ligase
MGRMLSLEPQPPVAARQPVAPGKPGGSAVALAPPPIAAAKPAGPPPAPDEAHPLRKLALYFSLAALFVRFGVLPEVIASITGVNTYLLYVTALPAIVALLFSGSLRRTFSQRAPYLWLAFFAWMVVAAPFSFWPGGSARLIVDYFRTCLVFLLIGGVAVHWGEIRAVFYTIAGAAVVNLLTSRFFMDTTNGRISLTASGTIGNSNDLAAHLLLVLPFLLYVAMDRKRSLFFKIPLLLGLLYGLRIILGTASRGALVALFAGFLFMLWRASAAQRVLALGGGFILVVIFVVALPAATRNRLGNLFGEEHLEAQESGDVRSYLFKQSLLFTIQHPLFGVGPGEFANFEGKTRIDAGRVGTWKDPHCSFTQVSADSGIPALLFYVGGLGAAILAVMRTHRKARRQGHVEITNACFCYLLGMVGFLVAISLLPFAYHFYFPTVIGLAGSISMAAKRQLQAGAPAAAIRPRLPALA